MVWTGLVLEGLVQEEYVFVVPIIPVFAIAYIQDCIKVAGSFFMPEVDLNRRHHLVKPTWKLILVKYYIVRPLHVSNVGLYLQ